MHAIGRGADIVDSQAFIAMRSGGISRPHYAKPLIFTEVRATLLHILSLKLAEEALYGVFHQAGYGHWADTARDRGDD